MDELSQLLKRLRGLIRQIDSSPTLPSPPLATPGTVTFWHRDWGWLSLSDTDAEGYRATTAAFGDWAARGRRGMVSRREVERHLQRAVLEGLDISGRRPGTPLAERMRASLEVLRHRLTSPPVPWKAVVPVTGVTATKPVTLGCVQFRKATPALIGRLQASGKAIYSGTLARPEVRESAAARFSREIHEAFSGSVLALIPISAVDGDAAWDLARVRLEDTLDALNFLADLAHPGRARITAGGIGQPLRDVQRVLMSADVIVGPNVSPLHPFPFDDLLAEDPVRKLARRVSALLKEDHGEVRLRVLTALKWAARAAVADRGSERLLQYLISLETLLLDRRTYGGVGYQLGLRCAHLIGRRGHRRAVALRVQHLYSKRSEIAHGGNGEVDDESLGLARSYAIISLIRMLGPRSPGRLKSEDDFKAWFAGRVLSERPPRVVQRGSSPAPPRSA